MPRNFASVFVSRKTGNGQTGDGKSKRQHSRNQQTKMDWMGEFNSEDHYSNYCGRESLRRNGVAIIVNKKKNNNNKNQEKINRKQKTRTNKKVQQVYYRYK